VYGLAGLGVCPGSGFSVVISAKELNLSPLYTAVDHSRGNDNAAFGGDSTVVRDFCPYPMPLFYRLSSVVHKVSYIHGLRTLTAVPESTQPSILHETVK